MQCLSSTTVKNLFLISNLSLPSAALKPFPASLHALVASPSPALMQVPFTQPIFTGEVFQPSSELVQQAHILFIPGAPDAPGIQYFGGREKVSPEQRGKIPSLAVLATLLLMQPRIPLAFWIEYTLSGHHEFPVSQQPQVSSGRGFVLLGR